MVVTNSSITLPVESFTTRVAPATGCLVIESIFIIVAFLSNSLFLNLIDIFLLVSVIVNSTTLSFKT